MTAPTEDPKGSAAGKDAPEETADLAQAYRDLARGEQAATNMEANLSKLESKLDEILAAFEAAEAQGGASGSTDEDGEHSNKQKDEKDSDSSAKGGAGGA